MKRTHGIPAVLVALLLWSAPARPAAAQEHDQDRPHGRELERGGGRGRPDRAPPGLRRRPASCPFRAGCAIRFGRQLMRIAPEDQGPLRPGEQDELLAFAEEHFPRAYQRMEDLRRHKPDAFHRWLEKEAPRLRHLRRVYERNPNVGRLIGMHAENMFAVRRLLHTLAHEPPASPLYDNALQEMRVRVAENVQLEIESLEALAAAFAAEREERIQSRVTYLLDEHADLSPVPQNLRRLVDAYRAAPPDEREEAAARIEQSVSEQAASELDALRERIEDMQRNKADEVDRRMDRFLHELERRKQGRPPDPRHRGRRSRP